MKIDFYLIKDILQFIHDKETCIINGYELSKYFGMHISYIPKGLVKPSQEELENDKKQQNKEKNFLNNMMLLCDHNCILIDYYTGSIQSIDESFIKILPKGYELLYILKNFDISKEIENDIPLSIIIDIYRNKILKNYIN